MLYFTFIRQTDKKEVVTRTLKSYNNTKQILYSKDML